MIHNVMAITCIRSTQLKLSKLQQEFFDLVIKFVENDPKTMQAIENEEEWSSYVTGLKKDIKGMNAAELRHNIKVWKE